MTGTRCFGTMHTSGDLEWMSCTCGWVGKPTRVPYRSVDEFMDHEPPEPVEDYDDYEFDDDELSRL